MELIKTNHKAYTHNILPCWHKHVQTNSVIFLVMYCELATANHKTQTWFCGKQEFIVLKELVFISFYCMERLRGLPVKVDQSIQVVKKAGLQRY